MRFELLYRGSEFGCLAYMFHKKCDRQGPTVTFVQSADYEKVFGGFTSISWNSSEHGEYKSDPHAFVFSLTNETYHPIKQQDGSNAVWHHSDYLAYFGKYDFFIVDNCFKKQISSMALGHSFSLGNSVVGNWAGLNWTHLTGSFEFQVQEVEVYKVIFDEDPHNSGQ